MDVSAVRVSLTRTQICMGEACIYAISTLPYAKIRCRQLVKLSRQHEEDGVVSDHFLLAKIGGCLC